jgi:lysozyme
MKTSPYGVKQIAKREGSVLHVYKDSKGLPTAGVGHLLSAGENQLYPVGSKITQAQSDDWLITDLREAEDAVNSIGVDLTQNEFDALVSLTFNIGVGGFEHSSVARELKKGDSKMVVASAILLWDKPPEIRGRRRTEYNQFLTPYKQVSAAVASDNPTNDSVISDATSDPLQSDTSGTPPPITTSVEKVESQATQTDSTTSVTQTTVTAEQPKGDGPEVMPTQISQNGPLAKWLVGSGIGTTIGGSVLGWLTGHLDSTAIIVLAVVFLICVLIFRGTITDAIRMQTAANPDMKNVS